MDQILKGMLDRSMEVYIDDIVVKFDSCIQHIQDLKEVFKALTDHGIRLNPEKCVFGVEGGKCLGFILTHREIEANLEKCRVITEMQSPENIKEIQKLISR